MYTLRNMKEIARNKRGAISATFGILGSIALAFASYVFATTSQLSADIKEVKVSDTLYVQRISTQEATVAGVDKRLERIENKLDQALKYK